MARPVEMLRALGWLPQPGYGRKTRHTPMRSELVVMIDNGGQMVIGAIL
jgi:hypothetical protein